MRTGKKIIYFYSYNDYMSNRTDNAIKPMRVQKRLLQFNSLPFAYGSLSDESYTSTFKGTTQPYTNNAHGGYYPTLGEFGKLETTELTATISISTKAVSREDRVPFFKFIKRQLAKSGKLWAVQNGTDIIWTNARVISVNEVLTYKSETDMLRLSVTFELIDGYWVMASRTRTFLCEYCPGSFQMFDPYYCWDVNSITGSCTDTSNGICHPCPETLYEPPVIGKCNANPLCHFPTIYPLNNQKHGTYTPSLVDIFSDVCPNNYFLKYDCDAEKEWFCFDAAWGNKYRLDARHVKNTTTIHFCSRTDLPTEMIRLRLMGNFVNPEITINGDILQIGSSETQSYFANGILTIGYGAAVYANEWGNMRDPDLNKTELSPSLLQRSNTPLFQIMPGDNTITVSNNDKGKDAYIYVQPVEITY